MAECAPKADAAEGPSAPPLETRAKSCGRTRPNTGQRGRRRPPPPSALTLKARPSPGLNISPKRAPLGGAPAAHAGKVSARSWLSALPKWTPLGGPRRLPLKHAPKVVAEHAQTSGSADAAAHPPQRPYTKSTPKPGLNISPKRAPLGGAPAVHAGKVSARSWLSVLPKPTPLGGPRRLPLQHAPKAATEQASKSDGVGAAAPPCRRPYLKSARKAVAALRPLDPRAASDFGTHSVGILSTRWAGFRTIF